jgi:hypothetical protein
MFLATDLSSLAAINYIFYVVLGLAILAGLARGFKKSIFTLITMAIFYVVFFVTINQAVEVLWTLNMPWLGGVMSNLDPSLSTFTTFEGSLNSLMQVLIGDTVDISTSSAEVIALATGLVKFVLKLVWTVAYFTVILIIYKFLCLIIGAIFLKNKKGASKNRGLGAVIGVLNGLMAVFVLLIMMGGLMSVMESTASLLEDNEPEPLSYIQELNFSDFGNQFDGTVPIAVFAGEENELDEYAEAITNIVDAYNNNIFVKLAGNITSESTINADVEVPLHIDLFDRVLSFDYNENIIGFRYELAVFSSAAKVLLDSDYYTTQEITDITGDEIRDVFGNLSNSVLITSLLPVAIEVAAEMYEQDLPIDVDELYEIDFEAELASLGSIAGALFDILNGAGFIGGDGTSQVTIDGDAVIDVFDDIAGSEVILLLTENLLLPMLEEQEGSLAAIITVPDDLDMEAEYLALGAIFAEIIDADIDFADLEDADVSVLLNAVGQVDLTVLLGSEIVSEALVNILSGEAEIEGLDVLEIPTGVVWRDTLTEDGELRKILVALNALTDIAQDFDFENLDVTLLTDMSDLVIDDFFDSYVIRATISEIVKTTDLGDVPLVFPDSIYDSQDYFTEVELVNIVKAVKLILGSAGSDFDIMEALTLSDPEIATLLASEVIAATIGKEIYDLGASTLVVPASVVASVVVDTVSINIINNTEIENILKALAVLEIASLDSMSFDAGIISTLENTAGDDIDGTKVATLLGSQIVHATVSDMMVELGTDEGGVLEIPDLDITGAPLLTTVGIQDYISVSEITNILRALYSIDITDFDDMNFEDTSLLLDKLDDLLVSSIIHATVSEQILGLSGVMTIPEEDVNGLDVLIVQGSQTYIDDDELTSLIAVLNMLTIADPTDLNDTFDLTNFTSEANQNILLESAIMHATISETLATLGAGILIVPETEEDGLVDVTVERGSVGNEVTYIYPSEIKALINAFNAMGFGNLTSFGTGISTSTFLSNSAIMLESNSLQATISNIILTSDAVTSITPSLIIPDEDQLANLVRIELADVTYISKVELTAFIDSVNELGLDDFDSFTFEANAIFAVGDKDTLFSSNIMQATASKYILDIAGDENAVAGTSALLVPSTLREDIDVDGVGSKQIEKQELINIFTVLETLGMVNFADSVDATVIQGLTRTEIIDDILLSASFHVTLDNMLRDNPTLGSSIPNLGKANYYTLAFDITTKQEAADLIYGLNIILGGSSFVTGSLSILDIQNLPQASRDEAIYSLTIRQYLTPGLEIEDLADPGFAFDPITSYEVTDVADPDILNYTSCKAALDYFH